MVAVFVCTFCFWLTLGRFVCKARVCVCVYVCVCVLFAIVSCVILHVCVCCPLQRGACVAWSQCLSAFFYFPAVDGFPFEKDFINMGNAFALQAPR